MNGNGLSKHRNSGRNHQWPGQLIWLHNEHLCLKDNLQQTSQNVKFGNIHEKIKSYIILRKLIKWHYESKEYRATSLTRYSRGEKDNKMATKQLKNACILFFLVI